MTAYKGVYTPAGPANSAPLKESSDDKIGTLSVRKARWVGVLLTILTFAQGASQERQHVAS